MTEGVNYVQNSGTIYIGMPDNARLQAISLNSICSLPIGHERGDLQKCRWIPAFLQVYKLVYPNPAEIDSMMRLLAF